MTAHEKSLNRKRQSWFGLGLILIMVLGGIGLAWLDKPLDGYTALVSVVTVALLGKDGASFFSTPRDS